MCEFKPEFLIMVNNNPRRVFYILHEHRNATQVLRFIEPGQPDEKVPDGWQFSYSFVRWGYVFCFLKTANVPALYDVALYHEFIGSFIAHSHNCTCFNIPRRRKA